MKRKMLSALLCATLAASAMLTGCGNGGGSNTDAAPDNAQSKPQDTETASTEEKDEEKQTAILQRNERNGRTTLQRSVDSAMDSFQRRLGTV